MTDLGLQPSELNELLIILQGFPQIEQAIVYGSRAKGTYSDKSDIDLALQGDTLDRHTLARLALELDDSNLIHTVDLLDISELKNPLLLDHIQRVGVCIFSRGK